MRRRGVVGALLQTVLSANCATVRNVVCKGCLDLDEAGWDEFVGEVSAEENDEDTER